MWKFLERRIAKTTRGARNDKMLWLKNLDFQQTNEGISLKKEILAIKYEIR